MYIIVRVVVLFSSSCSCLQFFVVVKINKKDNTYFPIVRECIWICSRASSSHLEVVAFFTVEVAAKATNLQIV